MNNNLYEHKSKTNNSFVPNWLRGRTYREVIFPASLKDIRTRLQQRLASPLLESNGFFSSNYGYSGSLEDDELKMEVTCYGGRSNITFDVTGHLYISEHEAKLEMMVETSLFSMLAPLVIIAILIGLHNFDDILVVPFFFGTFVFSMFAWHRSAAADKVTNYLLGIVKQPTTLYS